MKLSYLFLILISLFFSEEKTALDIYADKLRVDPQKIEDAILAVAREEGLIKGTRELAHASRDSFETIIDGLTDRQKQGMGELMKRPEILKMYALPNLNATEIKFIFRNYPAEVGENAVKFHNEHLDVLVRLNALNQYVESEFNKVLFGYPTEAQKAMKFLVDIPQILYLLSRDNPTSDKLRKLYTTHPDQFVYAIDSIAKAITAEYDASIDEWKNSMKADPEALKKFEKAVGIHEAHLEARDESPHNETMMAKNNKAQHVDANQEKYFQQYGTQRTGKNSNVRVSVWVGYGYGFGYGMPYWYGNPYAAGTYGAGVYNPYHNPYWF